MEALLGEATLGRWARAMETCFGVIVVPAPAVKHRHEAEEDGVVNRGIIRQGSRSGSVSSRGSSSRSSNSSRNCRSRSRSPRLHDVPFVDLADCAALPLASPGREAEHARDEADLRELDDVPPPPSSSSRTTRA